VNIVSVVQSNLSKNFAIVLRRLTHHDAQIAQTNIALQQQGASFGEQLSALEERMAEQTALMTARMQDLFRQMQAL
jgi:hypothetical protein